MKPYIRLDAKLGLARLARKQQGQALVLAILLLVLGVSSLFFLFKAGRLVQEKTQLTDTADAVAYSAALTQARAFNFIAMVNRAYIAHAVAMAHLVTYASWAQYGDTLGERARRRYPPPSLILFGFPEHGPGYVAATGMMGQSAYWAGSADAGASGVLQARFNLHDGLVHDQLRAAQRQVFDNLAATRLRVMRSVAEANYGRADAVNIDPRWLTDTLSEFRGAALLHDYRGDERTRLKDLVNSAIDTDAFLKHRNGDAVSLTLMPPPPCLASNRLYQLRRRGGTALIEFDQWLAVDTQSFHIPVKRRFIGCRYRENRMGSGLVQADNAASTEIHGGSAEAGLINEWQNDQARAVEDLESDTNQQDPAVGASKYEDTSETREASLADAPLVAASRSANPLATQFAVSQRVHWSFRGLPGVIDLNRQALQADQPTARIALRLTRSRSAIERSAVQPSGRLDRYRPALAADVMAATAAAETYFERPDARSDGLEEQPSLFHPYWLARLVTVSASERAEALRRQGQ